MLALLASLLLAAPPEGPAAAGPEAGQARPGEPGAGSQDEERRKLEEQIARELGETKPAPGPQAPAQPAPPAGQGTVGGNPYARLLVLPDLSAVGRFAAVYYRRDVAAESSRDPSIVGPAGAAKPLLQEVEVALQAVVDPYARADVFLSFRTEGVEVEEAYLTTLALPAGLQLRAGSLKSPFGRQNQQHSHTWDFADAPLPLSRLLGADGLSGPGVDLSWLAPLPWLAELHLAWQDLEPPFADSRRSTGLARLLQYFDLAEGTTLGLGLSGTMDLTRLGGSRTLAGADLYLKVRPPRGRAYLALQGEFLAHNLGAAGGAAEVGGYGQAVWRTGPRWALGARYDDAPALSGGRERRWSALGSFLPSEFLRLRAQLASDRLPGGRRGLEAILHLEFAIGAHGAHPF